MARRGKVLVRRGKVLVRRGKVLLQKRGVLALGKYWPGKNLGAA